MSDEIMIGVLEYNEAKRIKSALGEKGINVRLQTNPQTCSTRGCRITVEVFARESDVPVIGEFFQQERNRNLEGLDVNPDLHEQVFDPEKETARCPACGETFSTSMKACPECGLVFMVDGAE